LGLASYYRRYIPCFAEIAAPLYHLTNKGVPFEWSSFCQSAFSNLKDSLTSAPVLKYPGFTPSAQQFHLYTDASATGIGGVLEQSGHVIAYVSRALTKSEQNYSVIQRDSCVCLKAVQALPPGTTIQDSYRPCPTTMALCPENGGLIGTMGTCSSRI